MSLSCKSFIQLGNRVDLRKISAFSSEIITPFPLSKSNSKKNQIEEEKENKSLEISQNGQKCDLIEKITFETPETTKTNKLRHHFLRYSNTVPHPVGFFQVQPHIQLSNEISLEVTIEFCHIYEIPQVYFQLYSNSTNQIVSESLDIFRFISDSNALISQDYHPHLGISYFTFHCCNIKESIGISKFTKDPLHLLFLYLTQFLSSLGVLIVPLNSLARCPIKNLSSSGDLKDNFSDISSSFDNDETLIKS